MLYARYASQFVGDFGNDFSDTLWCADKLILETISQDRNKKFRRRIVREINLSTHWFAGEGEIQDNTK